MGHPVHVLTERLAAHVVPFRFFGGLAWKSVKPYILVYGWEYEAAPSGLWYFWEQEGDGIDFKQKKVPGAKRKTTFFGRSILFLLKRKHRYKIITFGRMSNWPDRMVRTVCLLNVPFYHLWTKEHQHAVS